MARESKADRELAIRKELPVRVMIEVQSRVDLGETDAEIAHSVGLPVERIVETIAREHWRDSHLLDAEEASSANAQQKVYHARWKRAVEAQARWLTLRGMELAGTAADSGSARDFKDAAQGARMFHEIATAGDEENGKAAGPSVALFFIEPAGQVAPEMKRVEQIAGADPAPSSAAPAPASEDSEF